MKALLNSSVTSASRTYKEVLVATFASTRTPNLVLIILFVVLLSACKKREEIEYYSTGEIKLRAPLDEEGVYDGEVTYFHKNGAVKSKIPFRNHHINGVLKKYYQNGKLESTETFINGKNDGVLKQFYLNGKLEYETNLKGDIHTDTARYYFPNGEIHQVIIYDRKGRKVDYGVWLPNGQLDTRYTHPLFLSNTDDLRYGQDYSFEIVLGNRRSNVVTVKILAPTFGVDSTQGTHTKTQYIIRRPTLGSHAVIAKIKLEWARKGSDTIWIDTGSVRHFFYVSE